MTRVNIGIHPSELCDQHLIAEYRELPRMIRLAQSWEHKDALKLPTGLRLGKGHMLSLIPFGGELCKRWWYLKDEMISRGFRCSLPADMFAAYPRQFLFHVGIMDKLECRAILKERIRSRLATAKRPPTWTNRTRPTWA